MASTDAKEFCELLLCTDPKLSLISSRVIIEATIPLIQRAKRFDVSSRRAIYSSVLASFYFFILLPTLLLFAISFENLIYVIVLFLLFLCIL